MKKCKHLVKMRQGKTLCRKWHERNFKISQGSNLIIDWVHGIDGIKRPVICISRLQQPYNYPGCPYNKKGQDYIR